jgi:hypothetical protein
MVLVEPFELCIAIGETAVGLRCVDEEFAHLLCTWCGKFESTRTPDFWLEVGLKEGRTAAEIQQIMPELQLLVGGESFYSHPPLLEGEVSLTEHWLKFRAEKALFHSDIQPRFLNVLLSSIYNTICEHQLANERAAFLFHGCGVIAQDRGYLFTGPSGAGKTTVARLSGERTVLNDETVLLRLSEEGVLMEGTPLLGGVNKRHAGQVQLQAIFVLEQGLEVGVRQLKIMDAFQRVLCQLFEPSPIFPSTVEKPHLLKQQMDFTADILSRVPAYVLTFRPDDSFWPLVEAL